MAMRICLLGPSYPFRGGIAHYMTLLARHLSARGHEVTFLGFIRQYPRWLYPGQTDRDPSRAALTVSAIPMLDWLNPATWMRTVRYVSDWRPHLFVVPWWTSFWAPSFYTVLRGIRRRAAARIVFICHNVVEHETNRLKQFCTRRVLGLGDSFLVHSHEDAGQLQRWQPGAMIVRVPHPTYEPLVPARIGRHEARRRLGVEGKILLFFGFVRPYKGLAYAIRSLPLILKQHDVTLMVAGEFWEGKKDILALVHRLGLDRHVRIIDRYIPNEEIGVYFGAADLLLLPYTSATQSGIVQLAYALDVPVVATRVGGLVEVVEPGGTGYLVEPRSPRAIAEAVDDFYRNERAPQFIERIRQVKHRFSWERLVEALERLASSAASPTANSGGPPRGNFA
ncbi:MAG: glycosyltransferase [Acidobacteria bacterium]|nr:MAG: glycosyltransferase [Acidobacteriota bacterium]